MATETRDHIGYELAGGEVDECVEWCPGCHDEGSCADASDCDYCADPALIEAAYSAFCATEVTP